LDALLDLDPVRRILRIAGTDVHRGTRGMALGELDFSRAGAATAAAPVQRRIGRNAIEERRESRLAPEAVAVFYSRLMAALRLLGIDPHVNTKPQEVPSPISFEEDYQHASYDRDPVRRWWRIVLSSAMVLEEFRSKFIGKCSPVHFFWGSFDLACTRFSGRPAPPRKGVLTSEAYSHEESSVGFWPGSGAIQGPAYYAYTAPEPPGLRDEAVRPAAAFWSKELSEFVLMYDDVRRAESPRAALLEFCESTYAAGAKLAKWDRAALERDYTEAGAGQR